MLDQLVEMGFPEWESVNALRGAANKWFDALDWLRSKKKLRVAC